MYLIVAWLVAARRAQVQRVQQQPLRCLLCGTAVSDRHELPIARVMRRRWKHLTCRGRTGDTCIVTCLKGFEGGSGQHTCGAYGIFVGTAKPCKRRKCAALTVPGAVSVCTGVYQDVCTPSCAKGYTPSASMAMTCSANGTFVGGAKCTMRHCDPKFVAGRQHSLVHIGGDAYKHAHACLMFSTCMGSYLLACVLPQEFPW